MAFFFLPESLCGAKNKESDSLTKYRPGWLGQMGARMARSARRASAKKQKEKKKRKKTAEHGSPIKEKANEAGRRGENN
jgi:hypothetical protein